MDNNNNVKKSRPIWKARLEVPKEKELIDMVDETCRQLGIKKSPNVSIYESHTQSPGAAGFINNYFFSTSALDTLSHDQLRALVAHELTHYKHKTRDITLIEGTLALAITTAIMASFILSPAIAIPAIIGLSIATLSGEFWYRRRMEREADVGGAKIAGQQAMIDTLQALEKQSDKILGDKGKKLAKLVPPFLKLYPTFDERVKNIQEHVQKKRVPMNKPKKKNPRTTTQLQIISSVRYKAELSLTKSMHPAH